MSIITIHCRLVAPQNVRQQLWKLMAERNTPLVNELRNWVEVFYREASMMVGIKRIPG